MGLLEKASDSSSSKGQNVQASMSSGSSLLAKAESFIDENLSTKLEPIQRKGLLAKAEKLIESDEQLRDESLNEPPVLDEFEVWEDEARESSIKTPIKADSSEEHLDKQEYLFDDESDFTTAPIEYHLASKKKIENYQSIFEITKEIGASSNFDDFFSNLNYSIMGQVGAETLAIFSTTKNDFSKFFLIESQGFEPTEDWVISNEDPIYSILQQQESVIYAQELMGMGLGPNGKAILQAMQAEVVVPIKTLTQFYGIIILGKLISEEEYISDDLEFVKVMADIAASVFERVSDFEARSKEIKYLNKIISLNDGILNVSREFASVRKIDQAYDILIQVLKSNYQIERFTFMLFDPKEKDTYKVFTSNQFSPETIARFILGRNSDIVGMVSNVMGIYKLEDFKSNMELQSLISNDELGIIDEFTIIPMINLNWLVGLFIIHKSKEKLTEDYKISLVSLFELASPVFANILILEEKENSFSNPFSPIEDRIDSEISKSKSLNISFTVIVFKVQNIPRMIQMLGQNLFSEYCDNLRKSIQEHLGENDHYVRAGQGKFTAILHSKDKEESEIVIRKIKNHFQPTVDSIKGSFKPSYRILSLEYPKDTKIKEQIIEMIEEA
ncbi:MAG: GAF domain-containing protein [Leptospiraceae bacterium]|nr:GAF domain-containing protein [Leptospiraceae bacterium]MCZ8347497.1 GAF domain-containing protein [Leptospiraceae bacterium]PJE03709.1 MAG: GAF domain-containing protein [Leptospira sp.]